MRRLNSILFTFVASLLIVGCSKDRSREQQVSTMISEINSPFLIASMNPQNLMDKSEVMKEGTLPFTYYQVISFFLDKELTGIDYETDAQIIVGEGKSFLPNFYGIFKVKEEKKFIELLETEANAEIKEKEGMKYAIKSKEQYCVVWNEEFAVISNIPMDLAAMLSGGGGKQGDKMVNKNIAMIKAATENEVNDSYVSFLEKSSDLAMLYDGDGFYDYMESMAMEDKEELKNMKDMYEGMSYQMFVNFNKGSVELELESDLSDDLKKKLQFIGEKGVREKLLAYGKSSNPVMTGSYRVDIGGAIDYLRSLSQESYEEMEEELSKEGLKFEDIQSALSGEVVYMVDGIETKKEVYDFGGDEPIVIEDEIPLFGLVLGVEDKSVIEKKLEETIMNSMDQTASTQQMGSSSGPSAKVLPNGVVTMGDAFVYLTDEVLFMSNDSSWANQIAMGKGVKVDNPNGVINENPMGMFADLTRLSEIESLEKEGGEDIKLLKSFYGSANIENGKFTLELTDNSENSLKILIAAATAKMADFEKKMNPGMEQELEEAVEETEKVFDELNEESQEQVEKEVEKAVEDAFNELNK